MRRRLTVEEFRRAIEAPFQRFDASETRRFDELTVFDRIKAQLGPDAVLGVASRSSEPHHQTVFQVERRKALVVSDLIDARCCRRDARDLVPRDLRAVAEMMPVRVSPMTRVRACVGDDKGQA
jgi:hypothetical protein